MQIKIFKDGNKTSLETAVNNFLSGKIHVDQIEYSTHVNLDYKPETDPHVENMTIYSVLVIYHL